MLITPENIKALNTTFVGDWNRAYTSAPTWWDKVAMKVPSGSSVVDYSWVADIAQVREWVGERIVRDLSAHSYTLKNRKFELTLAVKSENIEDDNLGIYSTQAQLFGQSFAQHPDELVREVLEGNPECFDGQDFFDDSHPINPNDPGSDTYSNHTASHELTQEHFIEAYTAMGEYTSEEGKPLGIMPNLLVVPSALRAMATSIVVNDLDASGGSNTTKGWAEILVIPKLSSATTWYLMDTTRPIKPFIFQERKAPVIVTKDSADSMDVLVHGEHRLYGTSRGNAGVSLPFLASRHVQ